MSRIPTAWLASCAVLAIASSTVACTARVDVSVVGAAPSDVRGLVVTVLEVWFSTSSGASPDDDSVWVKKVLPQPVTLDIAAVSPRTLLTLATQLSVPGGFYQSVYVKTADSADVLTASASSAGMQFNTQVSVLGSDGVGVTSPLEWLVPNSGLPVATQLDVKGTIADSSGSGQSGSVASTTAGTPATTSSLVMDVDAVQGILSYRHGPFTGLLLNPSLRLLDLSQVGGISGAVDTSALASGHAPVIASAQIPDSSGTHHVVVTRRIVDAGGNFSLYPLPAAVGGTTYYDVVISCADADTVIIRKVPVAVGGISASTPVQSAAVPLTPAGEVFADVADLRPQLPGGGVLSFLQAVASRGELPYVIASSAVDPLIRRVPDDALALSDGPLQAGSYAGGAPVSLVKSPPAGEDGAYVAASGGLFRLDTLAAVPAAIQGTRSVPTQVTVPQPALLPGSLGGTLTVRLGAPPGTYDTGFVAVVSGNRLVETADVSSLLPGGGGSLSIRGIPSGSVLVSSNATTAIGTSTSPAALGAAYRVVVRAWRAADSGGAVARAASLTDAVLGDSGAAFADVALP